MQCCGSGYESGSSDSSFQIAAHNHKNVSKAAYDPENSPKAGYDIYEYSRERKKKTYDRVEFFCGFQKNS
jgi:hypothetical protein